jgi:PAS domain S-box-containing protein
VTRDHRVERIIETSVEAFIAMDEDGVITSWNAAAERVFGLPRTAALGRQLVDTIVPPQYRAAHRAGVARFLLTGERRVVDRRIEITAWHAAGREFPVELAVWAVLEGGHWTFNALVHDITARRATENALIAAYEKEREAVTSLRELDSAKRHFVATVSHELRTPLTNVIGYLEILASGDLGELNADQMHTLEVVERNTGRLRSLIEDLLTVSRIEAGAFHLTLEVADLESVIREAYEEILPKAARRGQHVDLDLPVGSGPRVEIDSAQLRRALVNLLTNAINYTPEGGRIALAVRVEASGTEAGRTEAGRTEACGSEVEIAVTDTGIGIDPHEVPKLFTRFFRGAFAVREAVQGAGLGLAITKTIVEGHSGRIAVNSVPGEGTTFTVRLPVVTPAAVPLSSSG